jgi:hypothetical protein
VDWNTDNEKVNSLVLYTQLINPEVDVVWHTNPHFLSLPEMTCQLEPILEVDFGQDKNMYQLSLGQDKLPSKKNQD